MNITPLQYAKALLLVTEHASEQEAQENIMRFAERLKRDGQIRNLPRIAEKFTTLWNASNGVVDAEVISRAPLGVADRALIEQSIMKRYQANAVIITNTINDAIGGGLVIRVGDEILDASVAMQLKKLRKHLGAH